MADARIVVRDRRDSLGEGLLWSRREGAVFWVDILSRRVNRLTLADEAVTEWELPDIVGWLIERDRGGFVAGVGRAFVALTLDPLAIEALAAPEPDREGNRFNDAKADAAGRIYAGSMPFTCDRPSGAFYRLDPGGRATRLEDGYTIPNGPAFGGDDRGAFLLHTDTALRTVFRYPVNDDGSLGPRTPFIAFEDGWGDPDGMTFDDEGGLWIACWGAGCVARFDAEGRRERRVALPASQITNVAFAGEALDRMFVTSAAVGLNEPQGGALFEIDPGCRGRDPYQYKG